MQTSQRDNDMVLACADLVRRTGASAFQIRYSDDEQPVVWMAVAEYPGQKREVAAGFTPVKAMFRLLEALVDGGQCKHCSRPTGVSEDFTTMPAGDLVCWYQYDPELKTFRRGCE